MTPEAQNEAVSEALGQVYHKPTESEIASGSYYQYEPNYANDLSTMVWALREYFTNQVTEGFYHPQWWEYCENLKVSTGGSKMCWNGFNYDMATAAQRCEAFLKTIGKWDDSK